MKVASLAGGYEPVSRCAMKRGSTPPHPGALRYALVVTPNRFSIPGAGICGNQFWVTILPRRRQSDALVFNLTFADVPGVNSTARSLLETVLSIEAGLNATERHVVDVLLHGSLVRDAEVSPSGPQQFLLTQKEAARRLSVSRVTIWRFVKDGHLTAVELPNGSLRYRCADVLALADASGRVSTARTAA